MDPLLGENHRQGSQANGQPISRRRCVPSRSAPFTRGSQWPSPKLPPNTAPCRPKHGRQRRTQFIGHHDWDTKARPTMATMIVDPGTHPAKCGIAASRRITDNHHGDRANAPAATPHDTTLREVQYKVRRVGT
ncbi:hypothetical protein R1flu_006674 [Riccia fluitans]|uniref:Uncharacterized protein n=1 Tax=Riccia fluitans TaxID=41844 RepID=A0ABD1YWP1_9MARC